MDFTENLPLLLGVIAFIILQFFLNRRQKLEKTTPEIIHSLLSEVKQNLKFIEISAIKPQFKKLKNDAWKRNGNRIDFLDEPLRTTLSDTFNMVDEFNQQIDIAKKRGSTSYIYDINPSKLEKPFTNSKEGLEEWLVTNTGRKDLPPKYPGIFDGLFGGR
jgi:hypothetical protein